MVSGLASTQITSSLAHRSHHCPSNSGFILSTATERNQEVVSRIKVEGEDNQSAFQGVFLFIYFSLVSTSIQSESAENSCVLGTLIGPSVTHCIRLRLNG